MIFVIIYSEGGDAADCVDLMMSNWRSQIWRCCFFLRWLIDCVLGCLRFGKHFFAAKY
jgi:hypothetical protein